MGRQTPLYQQHRDAGARIVDFAGWDMPLQYGSVIDEHHAVRSDAGVFDVSHMTVVDIRGEQARAFLRYLLLNDVDRLQEDGQAQYTAMLNETGGVIDDLIVYRLPDRYRLVVNCATRDKDLAWIEQQAADFRVEISERPQLAMLAIHGPHAIERLCALLEPASAEAVSGLKNFRALDSGGWLIARTGYTGEKGLEVMLPADEAPGLWQRLLDQAVQPAGLGARDTLRLEAGMNLYGHEMDEQTSPLAANMDSIVAWEPENRHFIGRQALAEHRAQQARGELPRLVGLALTSRGVMREGQRLVCHRRLDGDEEQGEGIITSGTFSPTLKHSIALARIPANTIRCEVDLRGRLTPVDMLKPGFVRNGQPMLRPHEPTEDR